MKKQAERLAVERIDSVFEKPQSSISNRFRGRSRPKINPWWNVRRWRRPNVNFDEDSEE